MKKCVVFDFDCTITYYHWFKTMRGVYKKYDLNGVVHNLATIQYTDEDSKKMHASIPIHHIPNKDFGYPRHLCEIIMGGKKRINEIKKFFRTLSNHGVILVIASHGYVDEICNILRTVGINPNIFKYIFGNTLTQPAIRGTDGKLSYTKMTKVDKIQFIKSLHKSVKDIAYIDDSPKFDYYDTFIIKNINTIPLKSENGGMNQDHMEYILALMNINGNDVRCMNF
uniref:Haloacid dehalogenase-like hydrolase n=1 Tax=Mimivirus LCMiAC01 TaxID=2506608 RepID=A0A481YZV4_9VIRU|nr:MAG: hypothetical protein LCMiAC01_04300 [Mimivirus LCMiAC01]